MTRFRDWPISRDMADEQSSPFSRDREDDRFMVVVMVLRCLVVGCWFCFWVGWLLLLLEKVNDESMNMNMRPVPFNSD